MAPQYESDGTRVTLRVFDGTFDARLAALVARWNGEGRDVDLDSLLVLTALKDRGILDSKSAAALLQTDIEGAKAILDRLALPRSGFLERGGHARSATYRLAKGVAKDLLGKAAYTRTRGLNPVRYAEMVREYLADHGTIANKELRELLGLGESPSAQVEASKLLRRWSGPKGFLAGSGESRRRRYRLRQNG